MGTTDSSRYLSNLPLLDSFFEVADPSNYRPLPDDWYVAVTDIENSTDAVKKGNYKLVNILGASSIVGLLNLDNKDEIPYTFGGDGCAICIPPSMLEATRRVLGSSQKIGRIEYGLKLRAAIIPAGDIREAGYEINVARYKVSDAYKQAIFSGGGISYAEQMLKEEIDQSYLVSENDQAEKTDFTGLECRWQKVKQKGKVVMTLLVQSGPEWENTKPVYDRVLQELRNIFGFDDTTNPLSPDRLNMHLSLRELSGEIKFRTFGMSLPQHIKYILKLQFQNIAGKILMALGYKTSETDWSMYKTDLAINSDHRKFDDMLRLVINGSKEQCSEMQQYLQARHEEGELAYGIHFSDSVIVTCMVFKYQSQHIHFVDGSDGGYVQASTMLKRQLAELEAGR